MILSLDAECEAKALLMSNLSYIHHPDKNVGFCPPNNRNNGAWSWASHLTHNSVAFPKKTVYKSVIVGFRSDYRVTNFEFKL